MTFDVLSLFRYTVIPLYRAVVITPLIPPLAGSHACLDDIDDIVA